MRVDRARTSPDPAAHPARARSRWWRDPERGGAMNRVIQGLWIGESLSAMERLSIASFLANGHEFDLYAYGQVSGLPAGTRLRDANEVLPRDCVFRYRDHPSYAGFA